MKKILLFCCSMLICDAYNMELLSQLEFEVESSDITGFYQDGREIAVVGLTGNDSAVFVDVTDPYSPFEISRISGNPSIWRYLKYWDEHVYIGTEADDGVKVVDVSDIDNPTLVYTITDVDNSHNIHVYDGYLYVVGADEYHMWIYDLSDPSEPLLVGTWNDEYIHDLQVYNDKAYAMSIYSSTAYIIDLSDKSNPITLTSWQYPGMAHDCAVTEDENYLVTADEMEGGYIRIWDIRDYDNIIELDFFITTPLHSVHNIYIKNNLLYASWYADGVRVFDISDPYDMVEVAYYDTSDSTGGTFSGAWGAYPWLPSNNILVTDRQEGLHILSVDNIDFSVENLNAFLDVQIYPNPSADEFRIDLENVSWHSISVVDMNGRLLESHINENRKTSILLGENWLPGTYLVDIEDAMGLRISYKLIKE